MATANSITRKSRAIKPQKFLLALVALVALVAFAVLLLSPSPAFAANKGKIGTLVPPGNAGVAPGAGQIEKTIILIEVEGERGFYVWVTSEDVNLEVGDAVVFDVGPGRTATNVVSDNPV